MNLKFKNFQNTLLKNSETVDNFIKKKYNISKVDMVIVDLYPFQETVESGKNEEEIIEKIDIGGVSLIRAAAKNFSDVVIVSSRSQYSKVLKYLLSAFLFLIEGSKSTFFPSFFSFSTNSFIALCLFSSIYEYNIPMWLAFL